MAGTSHQVFFGAVYFRKSNPPKADWERDFKQAAADGHNLFRHWVPWGAVEVAPGRYDWDDYDRILDLGAKYGIKAVLAEIALNVPEWFAAENPGLAREYVDGSKRRSEMHGSCVTGGNLWVCLDQEKTRDAVGRFLTEMANRYKGHAGLYGYDIWNEASYHNPDALCWCEATDGAFQEWLKKKYGDVKKLAQAWKRYSFTDWKEAHLARRLELYPDTMDRIAFHTDNAIDHMKWRYDTIRRADPKNPITSHGNGKSFADMTRCAGDDYRAADVVDSFGYTHWWANRCSVLLCTDMIRCASDGKAFWRAEAVCDREWNGRDVGPRHMVEKDRMHDPANIRLDCVLSWTGGATAYQNPRWRPLLDGPMFGAYAFYGLDGQPTERSEIASSLARWSTAPAQKDLFAARPVRGEAAILMIEEAQAFNWAFYKHTDFFNWCVQGAWQAFTDSNIQADIVKLKTLDRYKVVYLPYPVALSDATVEAIKKWVAAGGTLISEGCFGTLDECAHALPTPLARGAAELFGCVEETISLAPDRWQGLKVRTQDGLLDGHINRQSYKVTSGTATGWYEDGSVAVVDNAYGKGRTRLVGTMPGYAYKAQASEGARAWFAAALGVAGSRPLARVDKADIVARLWKDGSRAFVWVVNMSELDQNVTTWIDPAVASFRQVKALRGGPATVGAGTLSALVGGRDAAVYELV
jgi:beta-galactosidase